MKSLDVKKRILLTAASVVSLGPTAFAVPTIDGTKDTEYGTAVAVQTVDTGFGDNQSELDAAYVRIAGGKLHLFVSGNVESNFNRLQIFFDTKAGGQNQLRNDNPDVDFNALNNQMAGLKFDSAFSPDHTLFFGRDGGAAYLNYSELNTGGGGVGGYLGPVIVAGTPQQGAGTAGGGTLPTVGFGYNDSNTAGVGGGSGAANTAAALAVNTGAEFSIDISSLSITGDFKMSMFINGSNYDYMSNQVLGGLAAPQGNLASDGLGNGQGNVAGIDFNNFAGDQFFAVKLGDASNQWISNSSGVWTNDANWSPANPNASGDFAYFGAAIASAQTVTLDSARTVGAVIFNNASKYTIAGSSPNTLTIDTPVGNGLIVVNGGSHDITAPLILARPTIVNVVNSADTLTITDLQTTTQSLTKSGAGTLLLTNDVSTGALTINAGTLQIGDGGTTGSVSGDITNNGTLVFNRSNSSTYAGVISGSGSLVKNGNGVLYLTNANTYAGNTTLLQGVIQLNVNNALPATTNVLGTGFIGMAPNITQSIASIAGIGGVGMNGSATLTLNQNVNTTYAGYFYDAHVFGPSTDTAKVIKTGTGTLSLNGSDHYLGGGFQVDGGTLEFASGAATSGLSPIVVNNGATVSVKAGASIGATGPLGTLTVNGTGTADIDGGDATFASINTASTATLAVQNNGKLKIGALPAGPVSTANILGSLNLSTGGQLDITNNALIVRSSDATSAARNGLWQKIIAGQNGVDGNGFANWDGPGIVSSTVRTNNIGLSLNLYTVGVIANHDLDPNYQYGVTNGGWLNGAVTNIGADDILVRYTYSGDTNLDGTITINDYVAIDSTYGGTAPNLGWVSGDFNNDGSIGIEDYVAIDTAYAFQTGSLSQSFLNQRLMQFGPAYVSELQSIVASLSAVPEPTTLGALSLGAMGLLARRRRRD